MNELKFINKKHTLEELKDLLNKGDKQKYKLVRWYDITHVKKNFNGKIRTVVSAEYEIDYFYGFPNKYLNSIVKSYMIKNDLITIIAYGEE